MQQVPASQTIVAAPGRVMSQPSPQMLRPLITQVVFEEMQKFDLTAIQLSSLVDELSAQKTQEAANSLESEQRSHQRLQEVFRKIGQIDAVAKKNEQSNADLVRRSEAKWLQIETSCDDLSRAVSEMKTRVERESIDSLQRENQMLHAKIEAMQKREALLEENHHKAMEAISAMEDKLQRLELEKRSPPKHYRTAPLANRLMAEQRQGTYVIGHPRDSDVNLLRRRDESKENGIRKSSP